MYRDISVRILRIDNNLFSKFAGVSVIANECDFRLQ